MPEPLTDDQIARRAKAGQRTAALRRMIEEPCCPTGEETARRALDGTFPPTATTDVLRDDQYAQPMPDHQIEAFRRDPHDCISGEVIQLVHEIDRLRAENAELLRICRSQQRTMFKARQRGDGQ